MKNEKSMIELFKGYTNYSEDEYKRIWESAVIVVDTNILLNFYRYSDDTKREMFKILTNLKDRLWIPYQIAKEYFKNKNNVMVNSYDEYTKLGNSLKDLFNTSINEINTKKNSHLKCKSEIVKILEESNKKVEELLLKEKEGKKPTFEENNVENKIIELFNTSIGTDFSEEEYINLKTEGQRRIKNKIPPGYKDDQKEENGDYYIFSSMIKKSKQISKDFIFITDDVKEDWFNKVNGEKHGGRYELLNEFYNETGNLLMIYTSDGFVKAYNKNIAKQKTNEKFVDELINVRQKSYLNEKFINHFEINSDLASKLNSYKNYFIHNNQDFNKEKFLEDLIYFIKNMDVSMATKRRFINIVNENQKKLLEDNYYDNEEIISLINKLMIYYNENIIERKTNTNYEEIKYSYIKEISNIHLAKTSDQVLESYNKLLLCLNRHLRYLRKFSKKANYETYIQLEETAAFVQKLVNEEDTSMHSKRKLVDKLNGIIKIMDETYNMLIPHAL